ncbi:MAG: hypothetical protein QF893_03940 [Alphaproteobacteria bacterium]|jgi:hypothetical protein|nr:hypothetical protein [Alphaproteobacteria bacterium]
MTLEWQRDDARRDAAAALEKLSPCMLLVFLVGVPIILITRWAFVVHHAEFFERTNPSISKTAAYAPGSYIFAAGIVLTAVLLIMAWYIGRRVNGWSFEALRPGPGTGLMSALSGAGSILGMIAGVLLAALAIVNLKVSNNGHMVLSALFYASQVGAFLLDSVAAVWLKRRAREQADIDPPIPGNSRIWVCVGVVVATACFVFLFNFKDWEAYDDSMLVQRIYVASEYILATLCLGYAVAGYFDCKSYFNKVKARI